MADEHPFDPLGAGDYVIVGIVVVAQTFAVGVLVHLIRWRKWPPYITKNVDIVIIMTIAGLIRTIAKPVETGFVDRQEGDFLATCYPEVFVSWTSVCVQKLSFFVRVYRMWKILIRQDTTMWAAKHQIMLLSSMGLIPTLVGLGDRGVYIFDEAGNSCYSSNASQNVIIFMNFLGVIGVCLLWYMCRQLRWVRRQFNEYTATTGALFNLSVLILVHTIAVIALRDQYVVMRRLEMLYPTMITHILLWGSIWTPFIKKMTGDREYLWSYTQGFSELPTPAQLKASLAEQLSVERLRVEFRKYTTRKVASELLDFYIDSLRREELSGYFVRQAVTMRIVNQYIREGAPEQVNISGQCRDEILSTDVTAHDIFDRARAEVLAVMETNFQQDFVQTEGFQRLVHASETEQREINRLRAGGIMIPGTPQKQRPSIPVQASYPARLLESLTSLPLVERLFRRTSTISGEAPASDERKRPSWWQCSPFEKTGVGAGRGALSDED